MTTRERARPHGLVTDMARAIGWLALGKGVAKLPVGKTNEGEATGGTGEWTEAPAPMRPSKLVIAFASIAGVVLALFPRQRGEWREWRASHTPREQGLRASFDTPTAGAW
jgi:hypothetical protein